MAIVLELQCRRHLKLRTLVGMPELRPDAGESVLLQNGIYGRVRHPRYLSVASGALAMALFCHDPVICALFATAVPGLVAVVHFEELELRDRFGVRYDEYARHVPRFIPRIG